MNEKVKVTRFHKRTGVAIVRGRDGVLRIGHIMSRRLRRIKNGSIISGLFYKNRGEIR